MVARATTARAEEAASETLATALVPTIPVLQAITSNDRRGSEVFAADLGAALGRLGWSVDTVALAPGRVGGLDVAALGRGPLRPATIWRLRRRAQESGVLVSHGSKTLLAGALAVRGMATPFVYRSIGDPVHWMVGRAREARVRWSLSRAARVTVLWPEAGEYLVERLGVPAERVRVVPNAVAAHRFPFVDPANRAAARVRLGVSVASRVVVYVGALSPEKSVATAIDAVARLADVHLLIAGAGPDEPALRARAAATVPARVRFLGVVADPQSVLAAADALVLPSVTEGIPAVLIEAGLSGLPVVTTPVGGIREVVVDGETGLLVPPRDPGALAHALAQALEVGAELGSAARARCLARFTLDAVAREWSGLLAEVVGG